jgi:ATP-dependent Lhr-like helicase
VPWRDLQWALRRFEDRGLVRGGRFVSGFSGEQYALPAAMDGLNAVRKAARTGERVTVNACDPLNLTGVIIRGPRTPAVRTNSVTYIDGLPARPEDHDGLPARPADHEAETTFQRNPSMSAT